MILNTYSYISFYYHSKRNYLRNNNNDDYNELLRTVTDHNILQKQYQNEIQYLPTNVRLLYVDLSEEIFYKNPKIELPEFKIELDKAYNLKKVMDSI